MTYKTFTSETVSARGLEAALDDPDVSEIMINGPGNVWLEGHGRLRPIEAPALDAAALERAAIHIARPLGLDPATTPILDARLGDGSRVAICVPAGQPARGHHRAAVRQHDPIRRRSWSHKARCPRTSATRPRGCCTSAGISS